MSLPNPDAGQWVWDPAGSDHELSQACVDLKTGRCYAADALLRASVGDPGLRAARSQAMGAVVATSRTAETWVREHPDSAEARLVFARAAAARAIRAHRTGDESAGVLAEAALEACDAALEPASATNDATPYVIMLSLAPVARLPLYQAPDAMLDLPGPWDLLEQVRRRDRVAREAHHRMLQFFGARESGSHAKMWDFALWAANQAPQDSPVRLLPLFARAEHYRFTHRGRLAFRQWTDDPMAKTHVVSAYEHWFPTVRGASQVPVADLSVLAYALQLVYGPVRQVAEVLAAMMPYACRWPWLIDGDPAEQLDWAVIRCGLKPP